MATAVEEMAPAVGQVAAVAFGAVAMETLEQQKHHVLVARNYRDSLAKHIRELRQQFAMEHADVLEGLEDAKANLKAAEGVLKDMALVVYRETGSRELGPGVSIRTRTRVRYGDAMALGLARERGICLRLDRKGFETWARDFPNEVPFAQVETEAEVQIAGDLAKALSGTGRQGDGGTGG